jgi:hypothetical protein
LLSHHFDYFNYDDVENIPPSIAVTGSAKFYACKKAGDSLGEGFFNSDFIPLI